MKKKTVLFLYAEVMGYTLSTIQSIASQGFEVYLVHWDKQKLTPYKVIKPSNIKIINRSEINLSQLLSLTKKISPEITYISGWQDKEYMKVAKWLRKNNSKVVVGFDDQWTGRIKQRIASILGLFRFFSSYYSHAWVSGPPQFEYARRLGFKKNEIIFDLLSADLDLFHSAFDSSLKAKNKKYPHSFIFIGRFEKIKGVDILLLAWKLIEKDRRDWSLKFVGNGSLKSLINETKDVSATEFLQPENLIKIVNSSGCLILPSLYEPWGLVIHEFAAAGLPLISSDTVGANASFLIPGLNGYEFKNNNVEDLAAALLKIINSSDSELIEFSMQSHNLSYRVSSETSARNFLSIAN